MLTHIAGARDCIELAHVAPFNLSDVEVLPSIRQVVRGKASETLEPRVMQVLVALARANGAVVTRDQLIDWCWDGRVVSESAINRVVSRLRQIAVDFASGAFKLETINKVGYRLTVPSPPPKWESDPPPWERFAYLQEDGVEPAWGSRRAVLSGISVATLFAVVGVGYRLSLHQSGRSPSHSATELYRKGLQAREDGLTNLVGQAEAYFAQAVDADPQFATAWAALALARAGQVSWEHGADQETMAARARFAARRALQIDPGSVEAKTALALTPSMFGRWAEAEAEYRRLLMAPGFTPYAEWVLRSRLSRCLGSVGRCKEALKEFRLAASANRAHPYSSVGLTQALWSAGKVGEARAESDRALVRFPRHPDVWFARMALLTYGSRPDEAVAFGRDHTQLPFRETGEGLIFRRVMTARALLELKPTVIEHATRLHLASVAADWAEIPAAARFFAALGQLDLVFDLLRGYFFHEGRFSNPTRPSPGPLTRYAVSDLFWPPMAPVWTEPRFAQLADRIGLQAYWHSTGTEPDFRAA